MNRRLLAYFSEMKFTIERVGVSDEPTEQLDELNEQFTKLLDDFNTLPPEQQGATEVRRSFYQGQSDFHYAAHRCILELCEVKSNDDSQIPPGQGNIQPMNEDQIEHVDGDSASSKSTSTESPPKPDQIPPTELVIEEPPKESAGVDEAAGGAGDTEMKEKLPLPTDQMDDWNDETPVVKENALVALNTLSYKNYRFCLEPILQLPTITRISEAALDNVVRALNEAARRASNFNACIESETRAIVAMLHSLLDRPTQVMVYAMARQVEVTGGTVTLNMLAGCLIDRSQNILPEELQVDNFSREQSRDPSPTPSTSGASASATRKPKVMCPNCGAEHYLHRCDAFKQLTYAQRISVIEYNRLCHNCFMNTHRTEQCPKKGCKRCGFLHNSLLQCVRPTRQPPAQQP